MMLLLQESPSVGLFRSSLTDPQLQSPNTIFFPSHRAVEIGELTVQNGIPNTQQSHRRPLFCFFFCPLGGRWPAEPVSAKSHALHKRASGIQAQVILVIEIITMGEWRFFECDYDSAVAQPCRS